MYIFLKVHPYFYHGLDVLWENVTQILSDPNAAVCLYQCILHLENYKITKFIVLFFTRFYKCHFLHGFI